MIENKKIDINNAVLERISSGKVQMRSRWKFIAEKIGLESGALLLLVLAVLALSLVFHYLEVNEVPRYFGYGSKGILHVIFNFPYELIAGFVIFLVIINFIFKKLEWGYKYSLVVWVGSGVSFIFLFAVGLYIIGIHEKIEESVEGANVPVVSSFYKERINNISNKNIKGEIKSIINNQATLTSSGSKPLIVDIEKIKIEPKGAHLTAGDKVLLIGNWEDGEFKPWEISILSKNPLKTSKWRFFRNKTKSVK